MLTKEEIASSPVAYQELCYCVATELDENRAKRHQYIALVIFAKDEKIEIGYKCFVDFFHLLYYGAMYGKPFFLSTEGRDFPVSDLFRKAILSCEINQQLEAMTNND